MGACLAGVCLMGVCLMGVHLVGVHLVGVYLVGVSYGRASLGVHLRDIYFMGMHRVRSFPHKHTPKSCVSISHGGNCSKNHVVERLRKLEVNFTCFASKNASPSQLCHEKIRCGQKKALAYHGDGCEHP